MTQLKMIFDTRLARRPVLPELPEGFVLRALNEKDTDAYLKLRPESGFSPWTPDRLDLLRAKALPDGIRVIEHLETGRIVASASAEKSDYQQFPDLGTLGWVMASEDFRGKKLGKIATVSAVHFLLDGGYKQCALSTDDWRHAALSIYLKMGWRPWLIEDDMPKRWQDICNVLGFTYSDLQTFAPDRTLLPAL